MYKVKLFGHWANSSDLANEFEKHSFFSNKNGWGCFEIVAGDEYDYAVIINDSKERPLLPKNKIILIHMEPKQTFLYPSPNGFFSVWSHDKGYNNISWHLSKNYNSLLTEKIVKDEAKSSFLSVILSSKSQDEGQRNRLLLLERLLNSKIKLDIYGEICNSIPNPPEHVSLCGVLPSRQKDDGLFPYKYTFNGENHYYENYFTEKIIDAILSESLIFYLGTSSVKSFINPLAYVQLPIDDLGVCIHTIQTAISENWWEKRISIIREEKKNILTKLHFYPRLNNLLLGLSFISLSNS